MKEETFVLLISDMRKEMNERFDSLEKKISDHKCEDIIILKGFTASHEERHKRTRKRLVFGISVFLTISAALIRWLTKGS